MPGEANDSKKTKRSRDPLKDSANTLIAAKLRTYYDSIVQEGIPDDLLNLLEQLDEAEKKSGR
ncbi:hypothetical protein FE840_001795 [Peteryoungia desertarenae]|uniref:Anti-sigma factor NepR domain-containing protein n=1 Tax=Peteryoungia desertarenae TaxID=1813451 RepID=A0ABX6QRH2_9HYPH|nr:NepR family anti-sigma factor [Peteryoungia desertarenae]QLF71226.1 hypothetical protein FE840_001795 [Peteryoungia desertarenae]